MICNICKQPIECAYTTDAGGYCHTHCYHKAHPYKPKKTLAEVINNSDDSVLSRQLCIKHISKSDGDRIVDEFNREMALVYRRRTVE